MYCIQSAYVMRCFFTEYLQWYPGITMIQNLRTYPADNFPIHSYLSNTSFGTVQSLCDYIKKFCNRLSKNHQKILKSDTESPTSMSRYFRNFKFCRIWRMWM